MPIFRINKTKNYTIMSNYHLKDKKLSFKAKGLLSYMLSLPDDWDYSLRGLCIASKDNETSIKSAINELKEHKYMDITKERNNKGMFTYIYNIYEQPGVCFPPVENPAVENQLQLNTKKQNTKKKKNIKKKNTNFNQRIYTDKELNQLYNNISFNEW